MTLALLEQKFPLERELKKSRLVMVGNGMAGVRTIEELLKVAPDLYDITVFGAEPHPNYNRILLSPVLAGEQQFEEIVLNDMDWFRMMATKDGEGRYLGGCTETFDAWRGSEALVQGVAWESIHAPAVLTRRRHKANRSQERSRARARYRQDRRVARSTTRQVRRRTQLRPPR